MSPFASVVVTKCFETSTSRPFGSRHGFQSSLVNPNMVRGGKTPSTSSPMASLRSSSTSPSIWYGSWTLTGRFSSPYQSRSAATQLTWMPVTAVPPKSIGILSGVLCDNAAWTRCFAFMIRAVVISRIRQMMLLVILALAAAVSPAAAERVTLPLDGSWQVGESVAATPVPSSFDRRAPVPGLANLAEPAFPDVDQFDSAENIVKKIRLKLIPAGEPVTGAGIPRQKRNWFWYRTRFRAPAKKQVAILKINKAQFGSAVWLNGKPAGEHLGCFTAGFFDLSKPSTGRARTSWWFASARTRPCCRHAPRRHGQREAQVDARHLRFGFADPRRQPGDRKRAGGPAPREFEIQVQTRLRNYGPAVSFTLTQRVKDGRSAAQKISLAAGEQKTVLQTVPMPAAKLWTPERPFLYTLETNTTPAPAPDPRGRRHRRHPLRDERVSLRYGDPPRLPQRQALLPPRLQHHPAPLLRRPAVQGRCRGTSAGSASCWWMPKRMHWNSFRFCIGPVPDMWLDIADEAGLLIQNEFFIWGCRKQWDAGSHLEYREWMRDNWNHPSVAVWDAQNETAPMS